MLSDFLNAIWGDGTGHFCLSHPVSFVNNKGKAQQSHKIIHVSSVAAAEKKVAELLKKNLDIYFCIGSLIEKSVLGPDGKKQFRVRRNIKDLNALILDLDCDPTGSKGEKVYDNKGEALDDLKRFCKEVGLPKPVVVDSGGGYHVYWLFTEAVRGDNWQQLADRLKALTQALNLKADPSRTADRTSVLRVPGTYNYKESEPREVKIISGDLTFYDPNDIAKIIKAAVKKHEVQISARDEFGFTAEETAMFANTVDRPVDIEELKTALTFVQADDYDDWIKVLIAVKSSLGEDGFDAIHEWSKTVPGYEDEDNVRHYWDGLNPDGSRNVGSVFYVAIQNGYTISKDLVKVGSDSDDKCSIFQSISDSDFKIPGGYVLTKHALEYEVETDEDGQGKTRRLCNPIAVYATTHDDMGTNFGKLVVWKDANNNTRRLSISDDELLTIPKVVLGRLAQCGLNIAIYKNNIDRIITYLSICKPTEKMLCTSSVGWNNGSYVLPHKPISPEGAKRIIYQPSANERTVGAQFNESGTLDDWKTHIASKCVGNSRLILAISAAFAGPLLELMGAENIGVHFVGKSSRGKSTALKIAASVYSDPKFIVPWRATDNGLEGIAKSRNDNSVILDEINQANPKKVGQCIYMLMNGMGKSRADQTGAARDINRWRCTIISSGEKTADQIMQEAKQRTMAGMEVRLVNIPSDIEGGHGIFEELHGAASGATLSDDLSRSASKSYGIPGNEFIQNLVERVNKDPDGFKNKLMLAVDSFVNSVTSNADDGQVRRVANTFGVIYAAGSLATYWVLTGWSNTEVFTAVEKCFKDWLATRGGTGSLEEIRAVVHVAEFLRRFGDSRFQSLTVINRVNTLDGDRYIQDSLGYRAKNGDSIEFWIPSNLFANVICQGERADTIKETLIKCDVMGSNRMQRTIDGNRSDYLIINYQALLDVVDGTCSAHLHSVCTP